MIKIDGIDEYYSVYVEVICGFDDETMVLESINFKTLSKAKRYLEEFISDKRTLKENIGEIYGNVLNYYTFMDTTMYYAPSDCIVKLVKCKLEIIEGE